MPSPSLPTTARTIDGTMKMNPWHDKLWHDELVDLIRSDVGTWGYGMAWSGSDHTNKSFLQLQQEIQKFQICALRAATLKTEIRN